MENKVLSVRLPRKSFGDLAHLLKKEIRFQRSQKADNGAPKAIKVTNADIIASCLHGARHGQFLTPEGRWEAIDNLK